ncbi:LysR family transcriptional regulator [Planktothrix mougeotii]|uniref:LysR family transcriptional regulator n=1 Tax=Planktothrix mougeotii LEGE 06226 TaxID=1828728 RepID=A0ABR9U731_9CYAN|nr:LysR family transcriptional regulator [Planktothrix mougeotii]MBE9142268.1 LysR family transcriptional regulator [Planktothrix mougeotii LEGE 06226]
MNPQNLKLSQLRALVAVAEAGNFSEAALNLNLSQSTVSHAIATLEAELGVILIKRGRYGAVLTPLGERMVSQARQIQEILAQMVQEANREKGLQGGNIRIVSFRSVSTHILPSVIAQFRNHFPDVTVSLTEFDDTPEMEHAVRTGQADIGFTYLPTSPEFEVWEILKDDYIAILPPHYNINSSRLTWEQLVSYPLILSSTSCCSSLILKYLKKTNFPLNIAYHVREDSTILGMVAQGLGVSIIPGLAARPVPPLVQVCQLPDPLIRVIGVMVLKNALHSPAVYTFLDALRQVGRFNKKAV